jgi:hypothetical protein
MEIVQRSPLVEFETGEKPRMWFGRTGVSERPA